MKGKNEKKVTKKQTSKKTSANTKQKNALKCAEPKSPKKSTGNTTTKSTAKPKKQTQEFMLRKNGLDKEGNQQYTAIRVYKRKPKGWTETKGATTAPVGYKWISNNKSLFSGERKAALLKESNHEQKK